MNSNCRWKNAQELKPRKLKDLATPQHAFDNDSNLIGEQLQSSGPLKASTCKFFRTVCSTRQTTIAAFAIQWYENEWLWILKVGHNFDFYGNTTLVSIEMLVCQGSLWNRGKTQLKIGLFVNQRCHWTLAKSQRARKSMLKLWKVLPMRDSEIFQPFPSPASTPRISWHQLVLFRNFYPWHKPPTDCCRRHVPTDSKRLPPCSIRWPSRNLRSEGTSYPCFSVQLPVVKK